MNKKERAIVKEAYEWFQRLLDRDGISLDDSRTDNPRHLDEMEYTIAILDDFDKLLHPKRKVS